MEVFTRSNRDWSVGFIILLTLSLSRGLLEARESEITIPMPTVTGGPKHNDYMCVGVSLSKISHSYIVGYEPRADPRVVHHMLMFGCPNAISQASWSCKSASQVCPGGGFGKILYAWALNASGLHLPMDVGMEIGSTVDIRSLVIQIHYGHPETVPDLAATSQESLLLRTTTKKPQYVAGIFLVGAVNPLPPGQEQVFSDSACRFGGPNTIHPFAFRTHAHTLGQQIVGYIAKAGGKWELIGTRSPQDAQTFYPAVSETLEVDVGDTVAVRCVFNTKEKTQMVRMGPDSEDEMCNFYIMYYMDNNGRSLFSDECWSSPSRKLIYPDTLPPLPRLISPMGHHHHGMGGDEDEEENHEEAHEGSKDEKENDYKCPVPLPPGDPSLCPVPMTTTPPPVQPFFEGEAISSPTALGLVEAEDWALNEVSIPGHTLGQVSAVAVDHEGNVHILHRGLVIWDFSSFNSDFTYRHIRSPIHEPTLLQFSSTGSPTSAWGEDLFYLPHGLTIDSQGAFWVTDVAMHQVFKFSEKGDTRPSLILGIAFKPGDGFGHFCQPASVAVENSGVFYVADGYCNRRILKFDAMGTLLETWDQPVNSISLFIPHKATLSGDQTTLYVADRENKRVLSYNTHTGTSHVLSGPLKSAIYAVHTNGSHDWPMYGVFGGESGSMGFTLNSQGDLVTTWGPAAGFSRPHDLTVDPAHGAVYVTEIGPNRIWKFVTLFAHSDNDVPTLDSATTVSIPRKALSTQPPPASLHLPASQSPPATQTPPPSQALSEHTVLGTHGIPNVTTLPPAESASTDHYNNGSTMLGENDTVNAESAGGGENSSDIAMKRATFNIGIFVAIFVVVLVILLVVFGILREHKYLKKLRLYVGSRQKQNGAADGGGVNVETRGRKGRPLHSLLGPSRPGFSRLKTYDSDSEDEEFPVFNRV